MKVRTGVIVVTCWLAVFCHAAQMPRNIVLMVGDGMGITQLTAAGVVKGRLAVERLPVGGAVKTFALSDFVTDSAAAGTALATGHKTSNGMLSMTPDGMPLKTLFEYAADRGKWRGLVVTCSVTHATPAAFAAHVKNRDMNALIAEQIAASGIEVLFGGGLAYFLPKSMSGSARNDDTNLIDLLMKHGAVATDEQGFAGLSCEKPAAALIALRHPADSGSRGVSLSAMAVKALSILSRHEKGFVLLVEGSQIDWFGHRNDKTGIIRETIEFDDAVGAVMDFAEKDGETLVVVTADHETGGMALLGGSISGMEVIIGAGSYDNTFNFSGDTSTNPLTKVTAGDANSTDTFNMQAGASVRMKTSP